MPERRYSSSLKCTITEKEDILPWDTKARWNLNAFITYIYPTPSEETVSLNRTTSLGREGQGATV